MEKHKEDLALIFAHKKTGQYHLIHERNTPIPIISEH